MLQSILGDYPLNSVTLLLSSLSELLGYTLYSCLEEKHANLRHVTMGSRMCHNKVVKKLEKLSARLAAMERAIRIVFYECAVATGVCKLFSAVVLGHNTSPPFAVVKKKKEVSGTAVNSTRQSNLMLCDFNDLQPFRLLHESNLKTDKIRAFVRTACISFIPRKVSRREIPTPE